MPQRASTKGDRTAYDAEKQKQRTSRARAAKEEKEQRLIAASTAEERALEIGAEKKRKREHRNSNDRDRYRRKQDGLSIRDGTEPEAAAAAFAGSNPAARRSLPGNRRNPQVSRRDFSDLRDAVPGAGF